MENNETTEKALATASLEALATASLEAATDLIQGVNTLHTINAVQTRMKRVAGNLMYAAGE